MTAPAPEHWIFAYGSLMWRPGFAYEEALSARLIGYRRCFCIYSMYHRGTPERPGLVLGLDRGGVCEGIAYRIANSGAAATLRYLREREQISGVYREAQVPIELSKKEHPEVSALAYIVERAHPSYAGRLPLQMQARLIKGASGLSGFNLDYLINTLRHLREIGIRERELERMVAMIGPHAARARDGKQAAASITALRQATRWLPVKVPVRGLKLQQRRRFLHRRSVA